MLKSPRRYYLLHRRDALLSNQLGLAGVWRANQEAQPGTPLPQAFPRLEQLAAAGYTTKEDLDGADVVELRDAGLSPRDATTVLAAMAKL